MALGRCSNVPSTSLNDPSKIRKRCQAEKWGYGQRSQVTRSPSTTQLQEAY